MRVRGAVMGGCAWSERPRTGRFGGSREGVQVLL